VKRRRRGWSPDNNAYQHRSPDPTKIERATATSTAALFFLVLPSVLISLLNMGIPLHKVHQLATTLPCNKKLEQDTKYTSSTTAVVMGDMMRGLLIERLASV
jgi:hypothetical protein